MADRTRYVQTLLHDDVTRMTIPPLSKASVFRTFQGWLALRYDVALGGIALPSLMYSALKRNSPDARHLESIPQCYALKRISYLTAVLPRERQSSF